MVSSTRLHPKLTLLQTWSAALPTFSRTIFSSRTMSSISAILRR
jgi:hypothetical protein